MRYLVPIAKKISRNESLKSQLTQLEDKEILKEILNEINIQELQDAFYKHYGFEYVYVSKESFKKNLISYFEFDFLKKNLVLPIDFNEKNKTWTFGLYNITDARVKKSLNAMMNGKGFSAKFVFMFKHEIEAFLVEEEKELSTVLDVGNDAIQWVNAIINNGITLRASDIHIERKKEGIQVRYRVDGVMTGKQYFELTEKKASEIYVRLKVVGNLDISEKRESQDGRIDNYSHPYGSFSMRVSTLNTVHGEKVVMRIFSEEKEDATFGDLGFTEEDANKIKRMLKKSNGIIYLAGATGSGKTTTLYAMINELDKEELNIYTIEDPVEKTIDGVNQVQVDETSKNTYPSVLKTLLRQDPDIMVVGEIRESETAKLAVQASLTGHLVITTIHANNAVESIGRLMEMDVESYLVGASSVGFLSQRLVRILCPHCKEKVENLSEYEFIWMREALGGEFNYEEEKNKGNYICKAKGCDQCVNGYKGRVAVIEVLEADEKVKELISTRAGSAALREYLKSVGYKTLRHDGALKAIKGITSVGELMGKLQD